MALFDGKWPEAFIVYPLYALPILKQLEYICLKVVLVLCIQGILHKTEWM